MREPKVTLREYPATEEGLRAPRFVQIVDLLEQARNGNFVAMPCFAYGELNEGSIFYSSFQRLLDSGSLGLLDGISCFLGIRFNGQDYKVDDTEISNDELIERLNTVLIRSPSLMGISCEELRMDGQPCYYMSLSWKSSYDHLFCRDLLENRGTRLPPPGMRNPIATEIVDHRIASSAKAVSDRLAKTTGGRMLPERLFQRLELNSSEIASAFGGGSPCPRAVFAQSLDDSDDGWRLFLDLAKTNTSQRFNVFGNRKAEGGHGDFKEPSKWTSSKYRKERTATGIYELGTNIFALECSLQVLFGESGKFDERLCEASLPWQTEQFYKVIFELVTNAIVHGKFEFGSHDEFWATCIAIGNFPNRIEVLNSKPNDLIYGRRVSGAFRRKPRRSHLHFLLKDMGYAHARRLGQYTIRYHLYNMGAPAPIFLDNGSRYRAVIPKTQHFGKYYRSNQKMERNEAYQSLEQAFTLTLLAAVERASVSEIASALALPFSRVAEIVERYRREGILKRDDALGFSHDQFRALQSAVVAVADHDAAAVEVKKCLSNFEPCDEIAPMRVQDLLTLSKTLHPPFYLVEKDYLNYLEADLDFSYSEEHTEEIIRTARARYAQYPFTMGE